MSVSYLKVGDVLLTQGQLEMALQAYRDSFAIIARLAAAELSNNQWQRILAASYEKIGNVLVEQGKLDVALKATATASPSESSLPLSIERTVHGSAICHRLPSNSAHWPTNQFWPGNSPEHSQPPIKRFLSRPTRFGCTPIALTH